MPNTQYTDLNIQTSAAVWVANLFTSANWKIYWQMTGVMSGTGSLGEVALVPDFPNEPSLIVLPPRERNSSEILLPAMAISVFREPFMEARAGIGEDLFRQIVTLRVDGYTVDQSQHMAFATMFRNWFREGYLLEVYDYESNPTNPPFVGYLEIERLALDRVEFEQSPESVRYYVSAFVDFIFYD